MKKTLLLLCSFSLALMVNAQDVNENSTLQRGHDAPLMNSYDEDYAASKEGALRMAPFWTEDFSGGLPAGWASVDLTSAAGQEVNFVWESDPLVPATFSYNAWSDFTSTTASNGFVWANSDRGLAAAPGVNHTTEFTTAPIDCSAQPSVLLTFNSLIGVFDLDADSNALVRVSNDGVNWVDFQPFPCLQTGLSAPPCVRWSNNPDEVELDISSVAGGQATVYIQFAWTGGWEYFWCIDDMELSAVPDYERDLLFSLVSHAGDGFEYGKIPESQLDGDAEFGLFLRNFGVQTQTNLDLNVDVTDGGGSVVLSSGGSVASLMQGDTASFQNQEPTTSLTPGVYTATFTSTSAEDSLEADLTDNGDIRVFEITDASGVYALDGADIYPNPTLSQMGTSLFTDGDDEFKTFTFFRITNNGTFEGADALINTATTVSGGEVKFGVHNFADINNADPNMVNVFIPIAETDIIPVTADHVNDGVIRGAFQSPVTLAPGDYYLSMTMYSFGGTFDIRVLDDQTIPQPGAAGLIFIDAASGGGVFGNGNCPAVRLSMDPTIGVEETPAALEAFVGPNPTNDILNIRVTEEGNTELMIFNTLGELVVSEQFNGFTTVEMSGLAAGVYSVKLQNGLLSKTELITVE